jgi:hypothetical protein
MRYHPMNNNHFGCKDQLKRLLGNSNTMVYICLSPHWCFKQLNCEQQSFYTNNIFGLYHCHWEILLYAYEYRLFVLCCIVDKVCFLNGLHTNFFCSCTTFYALQNCTVYSLCITVLYKIVCL